MTLSTFGRVRPRVVASAALGALVASMAACGENGGLPTGPSGLVAPETAERDALVAQYHAAGGPDWTDTTNWLSEEPLGTWYGVETIDDRVSKLDLCGPDGNNLRGQSRPSWAG
jgi:predicted small lipoprotein YifL